MLKITKMVENGSVVKLRLDGTITSESFAEIDRTRAQYQSEANRRVVLDMAGVTFMQTDPAQKLAQLKRDSLRIINCSPFIAALLETAENTD
ncbi:MAG TPA: STAS domain-containing protein [Candidatus Binatia bacterium]|nr:STAS domain-containing protein [Candidatus Binatia bacterium]